MSPLEWAEGYRRGVASEGGREGRRGVCEWAGVLYGPSVVLLSGAMTCAAPEGDCCLFCAALDTPYIVALE